MLQWFARFPEFAEFTEFLFYLEKTPLKHRAFSWLQHFYELKSQLEKCFFLKIIICTYRLKDTENSEQDEYSSRYHHRQFYNPKIVFSKVNKNAFQRSKSSRKHEICV